MAYSEFGGPGARRRVHQEDEPSADYSTDSLEAWTEKNKEVSIVTVDGDYVKDIYKANAFIEIEKFIQLIEEGLITQSDEDNRTTQQIKMELISDRIALTVDPWEKQKLIEMYDTLQEQSQEQYSPLPDVEVPLIESIFPAGVDCTLERERSIIEKDFTCMMKVCRRCLQFSSDKEIVMDLIQSRIHGSESGSRSRSNYFKLLELVMASCDEPGRSYSRTEAQAIALPLQDQINEPSSSGLNLRDRCTGAISKHKTVRRFLNDYQKDDSGESFSFEEDVLNRMFEKLKLTTPRIRSSKYRLGKRVKQMLILVKMGEPIDDSEQKRFQKLYHRLDELTSECDSKEIDYLFSSNSECVSDLGVPTDHSSDHGLFPQVSTYEPSTQLLSPRKRAERARERKVGRDSDSAGSQEESLNNYLNYLERKAPIVFEKYSRKYVKKRALLYGMRIVEDATLKSNLIRMYNTLEIDEYIDERQQSRNPELPKIHSPDQLTSIRGATAHGYTSDDAGASESPYPSFDDPSLVRGNQSPEMSQAQASAACADRRQELEPDNEARPSRSGKKGRKGARRRARTEGDTEAPTVRAMGRRELSYQGSSRNARRTDVDDKPRDKEERQ